MINNVWQLKTLVLRYCPHGGSSVGAREFARKELLGFARENPQVELIAFERQHKHPVLEARYVRGVNQTVCVRNMTQQEVLGRVQELRDRGGDKVHHFKKEVISFNPTIQGLWQHGCAEGVQFKIRTPPPPSSA